MKLVTDARRVVLTIIYNGKNISQDVTKHVTSFQYNDAPDGEQDDISLTLQDRERRWIGTWFPAIGDKIRVEVRLVNWYKEGQKITLKPGTFEVDSVELGGPPDTVSIKAMGIPIGGGAALREKRSKAWEKVKLRTVAQEVAIRAKLKLIYEVTENPTYDRLDQNDQTDFAFLTDLAKKEGISVKVSGKNLVLYDEAKYENNTPIMAIVYGESPIISYGFSVSESTSGYGSCIVSYTTTKTAKKDKKKKSDKKKEDPPKDDGKSKIAAASTDKDAKDAKKKTTITGKYVLKGSTGPVLRINEKVDSVAEANRVAKNRLREKNKEAGKAKLTMMGDTRFAAGCTITIKGFGKFDGKYIIISAGHSLSGGAYATEMEIRKVLGW